MAIRDATDPLALRVSRDAREDTPLEDTTLVERARQGDVDAYDVLVRRYQGVAMRAAYLILGNAAEVEDTTQEAFVKAYYALARFQAGPSARGCCASSSTRPTTGARPTTDAPPSSCG